MASKEERDDGSDEEEVEDKSKNAKAQQAALKTLNRDDDAGKAVDNAQAAKVRPAAARATRALAHPPQALSALSAPSVKAAQDEAQRCAQPLAPPHRVLGGAPTGFHSPVAR